MNSSLKSEHMIKPTAPQTYKILREVLLKKEFTQREISRSTKVSLGQINKVVNWLENKNYISHPGINYKIEQSISILNLFALFRKMDDCKKASLKLKVSKEEIDNYLEKNRSDITLCLTTALEYYSSYFRDPSINFYTTNKRIIDELRSAGGNLSTTSVTVNIYKPDLQLDDEDRKLQSKGSESVSLTSEFRTTLDLFCDGKAYAAKDLIKKLWGVNFG